MIRQEINDARYPYVVYKPENCTDNMPLVIQLHGAGEVGRGGDELSKVEVNGFADLLKQKDYPCITVMPQCPPDSFWIAEVKELKKFIEEIQSEYKADKNRIYLTGISMGGYGTWIMAEAFPEMFAAIAPCCGGGMVWKAFEITMPVWAFHGSEDDVVYPSESINMINKIRKIGVNKDVKLTIFDGVYHNSWVNAYNEELMLWLLDKKKN